MSGVKTWQIFAFSLVPLALVFLGVILGSIHGKDSHRDVLPTPPPASHSSLYQPGVPAVNGAVAYLVEVSD